MKPTLIIIALALLFSACQKEEQQPAVTGSISGTLTTYDPATPLLTTPAEGIKLWLVNYDYPFDTVTYIGNEKAILDSAFTDARGNYSFSNLSFGNYAVAPVADTAGYRFEPTDPELSLPIALTETDPSQEVSYSAAWPGGENTGFTIHLEVVQNENTAADYFHWGRQEFFLFCPIIFYVGGGSSGIFNFYVQFPRYEKDWPWGYTNIVYTRTNNFLFDFYDSNDAWLESYWITQDLGNTPAQSWWTINLNTHTITRDSISNSAGNTNKINNLKLRE